jgi:hypothetical protein
MRDWGRSSAVQHLPYEVLGSSTGQRGAGKGGGTTAASILSNIELYTTSIQICKIKHCSPHTRTGTLNQEGIPQNYEHMAQMAVQNSVKTMDVQ